MMSFNKIDLKIFDLNYREVNFTVDYFMYEEDRIIFRANLNNMELEFNYFEFLDETGEYDLAILDQSEDTVFISSNCERKTTLNLIKNLSVSVDGINKYKLKISFEILESELINMDNYSVHIKQFKRDSKLKQLGI